jgi:hypothetical protein
MDEDVDELDRDERDVKAENALLRQKLASMVNKESVVEARAAVTNASL